MVWLPVYVRFASDDLYLTVSEPARRWWSAFGTNKTWTTECIHSSGLFHEFIVLPAAGLFIQYWVQYGMLFFFSLYCFIWFFFSSGFLNCNAPVICMAAAHLTVINIENAIPLAVLRCFIQYLIDSIIFGGFRQCSRGTGGCGSRSMNRCFLTFRQRIAYHQYVSHHLLPSLNTESSSQTCHWYLTPSYLICEYIVKSSHCCTRSYEPSQWSSCHAYYSWPGMQ